jgi:hypothetical protein
VSERNHLKAEYGLRLFLVLITFALAAAVPRLDLFISLVRIFVVDPDPDSMGSLDPDTGFVSQIRIREGKNDPEK